MGIFGKKEVPQVEEVRQAETGTLLEYLEYNSTVLVNEENALQVGGIKNAIELIGGTIGSLPINLYKEKNGEIKKIEEDERLFLLNSEPNAFDNAINYKKEIVKDMLLYGKSYSFINKKGLKVDSLHFLKSNQVTKTDVINKNGLLVDRRYNYVINNVTQEKNFYNILEIEHGKGVLKENSKILETLIYINDYDNYVFKNATLPSGVLETDGRLTQDVAKGLKDQIERLYSGARNFFRPMVLEQGLRWKTIQQNPNDLMLDKAKEQASKDIERIFNLPMGFLSSNNNINVSDYNLLFLQRTISPIIVTLEEAFNKNLLLESEKKQGYYFRFDVSELMKMTLDKQVTFATLGLEKGIFTINEARKIMDLDPREEGDNLVLSLGGVLMDEKGKISVPNTGQGVNTTEGEKEPTKDAEPIIEDKEKEAIQ